MNKIEAYKVAQKLLTEIQQKGFSYALSNMDREHGIQLEPPLNSLYEVSLLFEFQNKDKSKIKASCYVTSKNWYRYEQIKESILLSKYNKRFNGTNKA